MDFFIIFIEGLASFLSPCVLPMLPMYVSYFAGQDKDLRKTIINSLGFVLGFTIIFVLLGIFASTLGKLITANINYINIVFGVIIILFGMHYMGIFNIKILNKSKGIKKNRDNLSFFSAMVFGMIFSVCWTPCVGVFLSSALMMSATSDNILKGGLMLLIYSIGLGIPFIFTSIFLERLKNTFNSVKKHYNIINKIAGIILIISGILLIF
ncbi:MAG: cytochrome c biogenesis protein CcdA [Clostridia bacterium]|nr:cytochrome c biogenesis protein CcdA [Clostridia bacterium]